MDRVRFGRALGMGAREAAKALVKAADAASSPNPAASAARPVAGAARPVASAARPVADATRPVASPRVERAGGAAGRGPKVTAAGVRRGSKRFGEAVWGPFARLSGVLWLEFTGAFFGLFALSFGVAVWRLRAGFRGPAEAQHHAWLVLAAMLLFGYFAASSFVRARRRGKR